MPFPALAAVGAFLATPQGAALMAATVAVIWGQTPAGQQASAAAGEALANAATKAQEKLKDLTTSEACKDCPCKRDVFISKSMSPQAAQHILDAQAAGFPSTLTLDRAGTSARRAANLSGIPTMPGMDRDEYPPATFAESVGASVRHISKSDNRSAGGQMTSQLAGATEGCKITMKVVP